MRRTYPRKIGPVSQHSFDENAVNNTTNSAKQVTGDTNRKAYTSAAMIGLAISMGASSLLTPKHGDRAIAAEPMATEPTVAATPSQADVANPQSTSEVETVPVASGIPDANIVRHAVQEGQTLWSIARMYKVNASTIATANSLSIDTVLYVGQVLKIPGASAASVVSQEELAYNSEASQTPQGVKGESLTVAKDLEQSQVHTQEIAARNKLAVKRQELSLALSKLKSQTSTETASNAPSTVQIASSEPATSSSAADFPVPSLQINSRTQAPSGNSEVLPAQPQLFAKHNPQPGSTAPAVTSDIASLGIQGIDSDKVAVRNSENSLRNIPGQVAPSRAQTHRVQPGDTLGKIAKAYGVSQKELARVNRISDPNFIWVNQTLKIPATRTPVQAPLASGRSNVSAPVVVALAEPVKDALISPQQAVTVTNSPSGLRPIYSGLAGVVQQEFKSEVIPVPQPQSSGATALQQTIPGSVEVATVLSSPFTPVSTNSQGVGGEQVINPYIQGLRNEVVQMRERFRDESPITPAKDNITKPQPASEQIAAIAQPTNAAQVRVNPEFSPSGYSQALREEILALKGKGAPADALTQQGRDNTQPQRVSNTREQVIATAPVGSENYAPIVQPLVGQMVSPDLPPLSSADRYLPDGASVFKGHIWPAKGVLTSGYGWRWGRMHRGIDIAAPIGTPVVASAPGVITYAGWNSGGYGNLVEIQHPDGTLTRYAHNNRILVQVGQQVDQGQQIAEMGSTGYSTGPHSHFEIHLPGQGAVNPIAYLPR